jgi:heme-degrading monooxygenase HmoA
MIMRIWRTQVDEARAAEYERFAAQQSLPMFRAHQGFEGHLFGRRGGDCVVVTIWKDDAAADALEASPRYRETVARITAAGFLTGPSQVDRFRVTAIWRPDRHGRRLVTGRPPASADFRHGGPDLAASFRPSELRHRCRGVRDRLP